MNLRKSFVATILLAGSLSAFAQTTKYVGGDISLLKAYEDKNAVYKDSLGNTIKGGVLPFLKERGLNTMRVRLFHTPSNATASEKGQGVFQDLAYVKALGKQIKDNGQRFMLDIHYSDTWADPSNQWLPKAWEGLSNEVLQDSVYQYTKRVLTELKAAGATPDFVQTGNEISYGMLWGKNGSAQKKYYASQTANLSYFVSMLKSAGKACREVCPDAEIILHTERVANPSYIVSFYKDMDNNGVDYDIIGTSYYSYYHGFLPQLDKALTSIENYSKKPIMVVETGYYYQYQSNNIDYDYSSTYPVTPAGQKQFAKDLIALLNKHEQVNGLFWWEMDANDGSGSVWSAQHVLDGWYNAGLWNEGTNSANPALYELCRFNGQDPTGVEAISVKKNAKSNAVYNLAGQMVSEDYKGIIIKDGKKILK